MEKIITCINKKARSIDVIYSIDNESQDKELLGKITNIVVKNELDHRLYKAYSNTRCINITGMYLQKLEEAYNSIKALSC